MRPLFLHLDDALHRQPSFAAAAGDAVHVEAQDLGPALRLWSRPPALAALASRLRQAASAEGPEIVFAGSGDFHHITPMLVERAIARAGVEEATIIHFDNHPDWVRFENGMHCGSWVARAARQPGVAKVITVGVCSSDIDHPRSKGADLTLVEDGRVELYPYHAPRGAPLLRLCGREWPTIEAVGEKDFITLLTSRITTQAVYITIDKDVLRKEDATTNWDQGRTSLAFLKALVTAIAGRHCVIGADVVGDWSKPAYGGGTVAALFKRAEALLDQPWAAPARSPVNEDTNLALLRLFAGVA